MQFTIVYVLFTFIDVRLSALWSEFVLEPNLKICVPLATQINRRLFTWVLELDLMKWSARVCHSFKIACTSFLKLEEFRIFTHFLRNFLEEKGIFVNKIRNFLWQDTIWLRAPKGFEGHIADFKQVPRNHVESIIRQS